MKHLTALLSLVLLTAAGCGSASANVDPKSLESNYGVSGGYVERIATEDGEIEATVVPTTLDDGRQVQVLIPHKQIGDHKVYMRDGIMITPLELSDPKVPRQQFVESRPRVVARRPAEPAPASKAQKGRSLEKEVLIVGGGAGAGAAIGAAAGGGKGAGIGALSGGIAGLVYDLATKNKK